MFSNDRCYRPDEIAAKLGVSVRTVYRMLNSIDDPLPSFRVTGTWQLRVEGAELNAYIERHKVNNV